MARAKDRPEQIIRMLRELEVENSRLKRVVADLTLDKQILADALAGKFLSRADRRRTFLAVAVRGTKTEYRSGGCVRWWDVVLDNWS
ncbi:MAG: hypothetical protein H6508_09145 [Calditrichaeota bacterium]|nr:hypothetical protein [Calditrichota bacterium]MCB9367332.1 hypothetical protein [Calditrichota bacterium]